MDRTALVARAWLMRAVLTLMVLLAVTTETCLADEGPFAFTPFGWSCETRGNLHYWSGECRDAVTAVTVEFSIGNREDFRESCSGEAYAVERRGVLGSLDYCESYVASAASYSASRLLMEAPELVAETTDWPSPYESFYRVEFWDRDTEWAFSAVVMNECERARVRELLLEEGRLARH